MNKQLQDGTYTGSKCLDVPLHGPGARYFDTNGSTFVTGIQVAQWYFGGPNGVELHMRVLGMRADTQGVSLAAFIPAGEVTEVTFDFVNPYQPTRPVRLQLEANCEDEQC